MADKNSEENIRRAVSRAKKHYSRGEIKQALKLLAPYKDNEKVRNIIIGIKRKTQETRQVKRKRRSDNKLTYVLLFVVGIMIVIAIIAAPPAGQQNEALVTLQPIPLPTTVIYYARNDGVRVRGCEFDDDSRCPVFGLLRFGDPVEVTGTVTGGELNGTTTWYVVNHFGQMLYVHSSFLLDAPPPTAPPPLEPQFAPPQSGSSAGGSSSSSGNQSQWDCSTDYNCSYFGSSCAQVMSYWNACPGDPSNLDDDNDGKPCESICGG